MRPSRRSTPAFAARWAKGGLSAVVLLVAIQGGLFSSQWLLAFIEQGRSTVADWLVSMLALNGRADSLGEWWRFGTFSLLHAGPLHLLGNLVLLYFAGRETESIVGRRHLVSLYAIGTLLGGYAHWSAMPEFSLVGTSAGVAAVVAAYATVLPEMELRANLFYVLPLRMRVKFLAFGILAGGIACCMTWSALQIGPVGIVVGIVFGWLYTRRLGFGRQFWWKRRMHLRRQREERLERMDAAQFMAEEVDPILEKIATSGMASLTRAEKRTLERGRAKMGGTPPADKSIGAISR